MPRCRLGHPEEGYCSAALVVESMASALALFVLVAHVCFLSITLRAYTGTTSAFIAMLVAAYTISNTLEFIDPKHTLL